VLRGAVPLALQAFIVMTFCYLVAFDIKALFEMPSAIILLVLLEFEVILSVLKAFLQFN
jgi:hypothetical protein